VKAGSPLKLRAPAEPGDYEVRYVLTRGPRKLAAAPVTITPVTAELQAPDQGVCGAEIEVRWTGPGYGEDFVCIARPNQPSGASLVSQPVRKGNPLKLKLPKEAGALELRYVMGRGSRVLVRRPLQAVAP
jgi:Ca-activated chloride channel family protein